MRKAATLVELIVAVAIIATTIALMAPAFIVVGGCDALTTDKPQAVAPRSTNLLHTVTHDGHLWVLGWSLDGGNHATHFLHHPDCPCLTRHAEAE